MDTLLADCVSTYLANDGDLDWGRQNVMTTCLPKLRRHVAHLGYPWAFPDAFAYFRLLLKTAELIHNDTSEEGGG
ncbi:hypothetical protein ACFYN5_34845 [Streptomyces sp. NPDC007126]|uniref:hypothetical protein n=1 Tax=Streptomyces sp. NPDC007126 TaxID=3364774 RepID=UPI0036A0D18F